ncbi:hypothetical protein UlMin_039728 [Ulmus minor]
MASIYSCVECGANLSLNMGHLYPRDVFFEAGNKGTLFFAAMGSTKFRFEKEDKIRPFFETINYWGCEKCLLMKIKSNSCGRLVGYVYNDGFGPSQVIPRAPRYRFKNKAYGLFIVDVGIGFFM